MNLVQSFFGSLIIIFIITAGLLSLFPNCLPSFIRRGFLYGKLNEKNTNSIMNKLEVPKRLFQHFYIFGFTVSSFILLLVILKCFLNQELPNSIVFILDFLYGHDRKPSVPFVNALLALNLFTIHLLKRMYETLWISVFSDAKINVVHYIMGFVHYFCVITSIIEGSEGLFVRGRMVNLQNSLKMKDWLAVLLFIWMIYQQNKTNIILSNLRKNQKGVVVTKGYKIPEGGLFEYISTPLQFTEIGIYTSLQIILCGSLTYTTLFCWVFVNQLICAIFYHQWNKTTFKGYPSSRKIIIPFLF